MAITLILDHTTARAPLVTTSRLIWIEIRRGLGLFATPVLVLIAWWNLFQRWNRDDSNLFWISSSLNVAYSSVLLAIFVAGLAAWEGGREGRRGMGDLLTTMPGHAIRRDLAHMASATAWAVFAYLVFAGIELAPVALTATWGSPRWSALLLGIVTIVTGSAIGYAAGVLIPSRFTPPVVTILMYVVIIVFGVMSQFGNYGLPSAVRYLTPYNALTFYPPDIGLYRTIDTPLVWPVTLWLAALGVAALAAVGVVRARTRRTTAVLVAAVVVAIVAATPLVSASDSEWQDDESRAISYVPICRTGVIEFCVHPAFSPVLPKYVEAVGAMVEPLVGLPGGPTRAVSTGAETSRLASTGSLDFAIPITSPNPHQDALTAIAMSLVSGSSRQGMSMGSERCYSLATDAQHVALQVVLRRALPSATNVTPLFESGGGGTVYCESTNTLGDSDGDGSIPPQIRARQATTEAAIDRFSALPLDQQRAWFATHLVALRAGQLTLADLP